MFGHPCTLVEIEPQFTETVIPTVLSFAKSKIRDYWKADVNVVLGDARQTGLASASFDVMITSPPYADKIHRKSTTATLRALGKRGHEPSVSAIIDGYKFSSSKNIGLLGVHKKRKANQTYAQAMEDVYRETFRLLKPGGIAAVITKDMVRDGKRIRIGVINKKAALTAGLELVCVRFGEVARPVYGHANLFGEIDDPKLIGRNNFFQRFHLKRDPLSNIRFEHIFFFRRPVHTTPQPHNPTNLPDTIQPTTLIASDTPQMTPDTTTDQITLTQGHVSHSDESLWESMPGLVWSNPKASDAAHIAAALLNPRFLQLLAIAEHFGTARLQKAWATLLEESPEEAKRAAPQTERILANILEGEHLAHAGN
jgi:hypothetical protein